MAGVLKAMPERSRGWRVAAMVAATAVCGLMAACGAVAAIFSPLVFDRACNMMNPLAWLGFILMIGFWVVCVLAPFGAWVAYRRGQEPLAWAAMALPLAWLTLLIAVLQFVPG